MRQKVTFKRKGTFVMTGGAEIEVENENDYGEIYMKGGRNEFKSFLPTEIDYDTDDWEFEILEEEKTSA